VYYLINKYNKFPHIALPQKSFVISLTSGFLFLFFWGCGGVGDGGLFLKNEVLIVLEWGSSLVSWVQSIIIMCRIIYNVRCLILRVKNFA
jgi:hypothetical protein